VEPSLPSESSTALRDEDQYPAADAQWFRSPERLILGKSCDPAQVGASMRSLLAGLAPADVRLDPFPHVVACDVLDQETYCTLSDGFPPAERIAWDGPAPLPSNKRFQLSAWLIQLSTEMSQPWKDFAMLHSSAAFFAEVVELFRDHWPEALKRALDGALLGHSMGRMVRDQFNDARILQDARIEINTAVISRATSSRAAHLDAPNRLFSALFYMRHRADDSAGGDLQLFRWKHGPLATLDRFELPEDAVEWAATIPYRANQLVIFPHGIDALHGVSVRYPTPYTRRYVFITAEIEQNWLVAPATLPARPSVTDG
jgi:hypothetical protein